MELNEIKYELSKSYRWYGNFKVELYGQSFNLPGVMNYSSNEAYILELTVIDEPNITKFFKSDTLEKRLNKELIIYGITSEFGTLISQYATLFCSFSNLYWGNYNKNNNEDETDHLANTRVEKIIFFVNICFFHNSKYFEKIGNNIEKLELSFNEAFDDLFYPLQPIIGRNKNNLHDMLEFKIAENKTIKFLEYCTAIFENKVNIINNNFICEDREKINKINDYANKILEETKNPLRKIDNSSKKILTFLHYKSTNIQNCIKDIKILTDYFRLITNNYTLSPNIVYLTAKDSKEEFCMLYDTEIKQYRYPSPLNSRIRIFSKNLNSFNTISKFFEKYDILETCIFVLNENNYFPRFSNLYLSRTIDCIGNIAKYELEKLGLSESKIKQKKYQKIIELYFIEYPKIINKIDNILKDIKYKEEKNDNLDNIRGKKIDAIRAKLVHFDIDKNGDLPDVLQIQKLTKIFELLICTFIFKQIGIEETLIKEILCTFRI